MLLTKEDLAKYPFLFQAQDYIKPLDLKIQDLTETLEVLQHAEERVVASFIERPETSYNLKKLDAEISSFPVAIMMVAAINDKYLKKRYALQEAKRIYSYLQEEKTEKILEIALFFLWDIHFTPDRPYSFSLHFINYLRNTASLQEQPQWSLINRELNDGRIPITHHEAARLLQEEIRKYVEAKLDTKVSQLPPQIQSTVERLKDTFTAQRTTLKEFEYPQIIDHEAFPPCIKTLYSSLTNGHHLSHTGRFTLTTFLVNTGMSTEAVLDLYRNLSDFNERLTRYQIEHIAGQRGSRTQYKPPRCQTLRTHGICNTPDKDCTKGRNPLACYRRKLRQRRT